MLRVHGCVFCYITLLFAFLCMRMTLRAQGPLQDCPRARYFWATLLLRTTRMRSQRLGGVSGVVAYTQKNTQMDKKHSFAFQKSWEG